MPNSVEKTKVVLKGGGAKGPEELFALIELEKRGLYDPKKINGYAGTSAGAILGSLLAFGMTTNEALKIMKSTDFSTFLDGKTVNWAIKRSQEGLKWYKAIPDAIHAHQAYKKLINDHGLATGDVFRAWIEKQIRELVKDTPLENKKHITFADLHSLVETQPGGRHFADLKVIVSNVNRQKSETFSYETTPNACIADAVRASMSLPFIYKPWHRFDVNEKGERFQVNQDDYIDGGVHAEDNYPLNAFDRNGVRNPETLGLCLMSPEEYAAAELNNGEIHKDTKTAADYFGATISMLEDSNGSDGRDSCSNKRLWEDPRSIRLSTDGVGTLDFGLTAEQYDRMQAHAAIGVQEYAERMEKSSIENQLSEYVARVEPETARLAKENERLVKEKAELLAEIEALKQAARMAKAMNGVSEALQHRQVKEQPAKTACAGGSSLISVFAHNDAMKRAIEREATAVAAAAA